MKRFLTRKRKIWALGVLTVLAAALYVGSVYLDSWRSAQYQYYNMGIALYSAGDHLCKKQEIADPIKNHCIDVDTATKAFGASMQAFAKQAQDGNFITDLTLPPPSRALAAWAPLHEGVLGIMKQKPEEAVKYLKLAVALSDTSALKAEMKHQLETTGKVDPQLARQVALLEPIHLAAIYDLELLFKKNPSQAQAQGKGNGKGKQQGQPDNGQPMDGPPTDAAGKGHGSRI